jgi:hypothetical protein
MTRRPSRRLRGRWRNDVTLNVPTPQLLDPGHTTPVTYRVQLQLSGTRAEFLQAGNRAAGGQLRAIIDTAGTPPDVGRPRPFNAVIRN